MPRISYTSSYLSANSWVVNALLLLEENDNSPLSKAILSLINEYASIYCLCLIASINRLKTFVSASLEASSSPEHPLKQNRNSSADIANAIARKLFILVTVLSAIFLLSFVNICMNFLFLY